MSAGIVGVEGAKNTAARPTGTILVPGMDRIMDGRFFFEDFLALAEADRALQHSTVTVNSSTVTLVSGVLNGQARITTGTADNDDAMIYTQPMGDIVIDSGKPFGFEVRLASNDIDQSNVFVGLVDTDNDAAGDGLIAAGSNDEMNGAADYIGYFFNLDGTIDACHHDGTSGTGDDKGTNAGTDAFTNVTQNTNIPSDDRVTLADSTFVTLGGLFRGDDKFDWYVNGVRIGTSTVDATEWPTSDGLGLCIAIMTREAAANTLDIDWDYAIFRDNQPGN